MKASSQHILTTHTGSLHRPLALEELFRKKYAGEPCDERVLEQGLRVGVSETVRKQIEIGIDVIDDGELSKLSFWTYARSRIDGMQVRPIKKDSAKDGFFQRAAQTASASTDRQKFADFYRDTEPAGDALTPPSLVQLYMPIGMAFEPMASFSVVGPLAYRPAEILRDIDNFRHALSMQKTQPVEAFMPVTSPGMLASRHTNEYYGSEEEYYFAMADALRHEYKAIVDAGFLLQIDDVSLPGRYRLLAAANDIAGYRKWAKLAVESLNHALKGIPPEKVRYHMCWSSMNAPHTDDPPLTALVDDLLSINAQGYQIEAANVRHEHEYHLWETKRLPDDKILMPGVICHATNVIEHPEYVAERIGRFANLVGRERVIAATDCGFRMRIHPQIAWAKLEALVQGAEIASKRLWRKT